MISTNCMALFCEDIREEANGVITIIGIIPDNVNVATMPITPDGKPKPDPATKILSKLCIFARINFDPAYEMPEANIRLVPSEGAAIELGKIDRKTIDTARQQATERGNLLAGVFSRATLNGFPIPQKGTLKVEIAFPKETIIAGAIYFQPHPRPISSTEH